MDNPETIRSEAELDERLTRPSPALVEFMAGLPGPLLILGAGGKMGPTLAVLAQRAAAQAGSALRVLAASRFSDPRARTWLEARGVETLACDLMQPAALGHLPDAPQVICLVGLKFGTAQNPARTWASNTLIPAHIMERFPASRVVALSTGNVYPLSAAGGPGACEQDPLTPLGEYANSCVARERIFEYFSAQNGTPVALIRLNYALDLRYGVLVDLAQKIWAGQAVDVSMGYVNCIWQGDANERILRALGLARCPARALNLSGPERLAVRALALRLGQLLGRPAHITGSEAPTALLSDSAAAQALLGAPPTALEDILRWTAAWVAGGGRTLNKVTHFEARDGQY